MQRYDCHQYETYEGDDGKYVLYDEAAARIAELEKQLADRDARWERATSSEGDEHYPRHPRTTGPAADMKTVRVRIKVFTFIQDGKPAFVAEGWTRGDQLVLDPDQWDDVATYRNEGRFTFVEADVPLPEPQTIETVEGEPRD